MRDSLADCKTGRLSLWLTYSVNLADWDTGILEDRQADRQSDRLADMMAKKLKELDIWGCCTKRLTAGLAGSDRYETSD